MAKGEVYSKVFIILFLASLFPAHPGFAEQNTLEMSIGECIDRALRQNLDLKASQFDLQSSRLSVIQAESSFDPALSMKLTRGQSGSPSFTSYIPVDKIEQKSTNFNFSLGKNILTGARWGIGAYGALSESNIERVKNYSSYVGLNVSQPLLRGFGKRINYSNIYLAHLSSSASMHTVESSAISLVAEVERTYWNLVFVREVLSVRQMSLAQADSLLAYNLKGQELGILTESDVLEAKSAFFPENRKFWNNKITLKFQRMH